MISWVESECLMSYDRSHVMYGVGATLLVVFWSGGHTPRRISNELGVGDPHSSLIVGQASHYCQWLEWVFARSVNLSALRTALRSGREGGVVGRCPGWWLVSSGMFQAIGYVDFLVRLA